MSTVRMKVMSYMNEFMPEAGDQVYKGDLCWLILA